MNKSKKTSRDFIQKPDYAVNFGVYRGLLTKLLKHDPTMFDIRKDARIVDIGCGFGDLLKLLAKRGYKNLLGVEPDELSRKNCIKIGLKVRDGTIAKTGLPNKYANVVIINEVFHHIDDYSQAVRELARITKPGGLLCFIEPSPTILRGFMDLFTFYTPFPSIVKPVKVRYDVMKLEMETGLYTKFLLNQSDFQKALQQKYNRMWHKHGWFFQFGQYSRK